MQNRNSSLYVTSLVLRTVCSASVYQSVHMRECTCLCVHVRSRRTTSDVPQNPASFDDVISGSESSVMGCACAHVCMRVNCKRFSHQPSPQPHVNLPLYNLPLWKNYEFSLPSFKTGFQTVFWIYWLLIWCSICHYCWQHYLLLLAVKKTNLKLSFSYLKTTCLLNEIVTITQTIYYDELIFAIEISWCVCVCVCTSKLYAAVRKTGLSHAVSGYRDSTVGWHKPHGFGKRKRCHWTIYIVKGVQRTPCPALHSINTLTDIYTCRYLYICIFKNIPYSVYVEKCLIRTDRMFAKSVIARVILSCD